MIIRPIDHRYPNRFTRELFRRLKPAEAGADDHHARFWRRYIFHATILQQQDWIKAPNSKPQIPGKLQTSISKEKSATRFFFWNLGFSWNLVLGIWGFAAVHMENGAHGKQ